MRSSRALVPSAVVVLLACGSCVTGVHKEGRVLDPLDIAGIRIGKTSKQEILERFGPPTTFSRTSAVDLVRGPRGDLLREKAGTGGHDNVFSYVYREDRELFFSIVLLYTHFDRDVRKDVLMIVFDDKDVVKYVAFAKETAAKPQQRKGARAPAAAAK